MIYFVHTLLAAQEEELASDETTIPKANVITPTANEL
jgi:hypothetical protein